MSILTISCIVVGTVVVLSVISTGLLILYKYTENSNREFETKMAMAEAQSKMTSTKPFNDLKEILNYVIQFICVNEVSLIGENGVSNEEVLNTLETRVADVTTQCYLYLSDEFKRQFYTYANDEFLQYYIRKTAF